METQTENKIRLYNPFSKLDEKVNASTFFNTDSKIALDGARAYAKNGGFIATAPDLAKTLAAAKFGDEIWANWHTPLGEEVYMLNARDQPVVINIIGPGFLTKETDLGFLSFTMDDRQNLLERRLPDGKPLSLYFFDDVIKFKVTPKGETYGIVRESPWIESGQRALKASELMTSPTYLARIGDMTQAYSLARKLEDKFGEHEVMMITSPELTTALLPYSELPCFGGIKPYNFHIWPECFVSMVKDSARFLASSQKDILDVRLSQERPRDHLWKVATQSYDDLLKSTPGWRS